MHISLKAQDAEIAAHNHTGRIGASRAPAILGLDSYTTPYQAWEEIMGVKPDRESGLAEAAYWGTVLESVVVSYGYEKRQPLLTQRVNRRLHHPDHPFITASLDRRCMKSKKILQVKCRDRFVRDKWGSPGTDEVPEREACQVMVEMEVAHPAFKYGVTSADVGVLFGGNQFEIYTMQRDPKAGAEIIETLAEWWHTHVSTGVPPDAVTADDCRRRWKKGDQGGREMTLKDKGLLDELLYLEREEKRATAQKDKVRLQLMESLGDNECLTAEGKPVVNWKTASSFDAEAFVTAHPELASECQKLDPAAIRKKHSRLYAEFKSPGGRGNLTINRNAAKSLLNLTGEK